MTATLDDLEAAVRAHAVATGAVDGRHLIVAWTLVGEAVDPDRADGVRILHLRSDCDPILELGLLTARQREMEDYVTCSADERTMHTLTRFHVTACVECGEIERER